MSYYSKNLTITMATFIAKRLAKRLSVRLIIMQAWQALVGSKCEAVLVCMCVYMSVCNGFTIEIYQYMD